MKNNKAGLLALIVLGIASLLMIFSSCLEFPMTANPSAMPSTKRATR